MVDTGKTFSIMSVSWAEMRILTSLTVSSTSSGKTNGKFFLASRMVSAVFPFRSVSIVFSCLVCHLFEAYQVDAFVFLEFSQGTIRTLSCLTWLVRVSPSELFSQVSWLFCWYSFSEVVPIASRL